MKKRACLALFLAFCLGLSGCGGEEETAPSPSPSPSPSPTPAPVEAARFTLAYDPQGTWDPYAGSGNGNMTLAPLVYEGLYALDRQFECHPVLAERAWCDAEALVWTVRLRSGVRFSDGTPLTAQTAVQAVERARKAPSAYATRLAGVAAVAAGEDETVIFTLRAPNRAFPALLDFPIALTDGENSLGTGPYVLGVDAVLRRRWDWWQGKELPLAVIPLAPVTGADELVAGFDGGLVSLAAADTTGPNALGYAGACQSWDYPTSSMVYVGYRADGGFCKDEGLRQALSLAFDRESLARDVLGGYAVAASYPAPPASKRYNAAVANALSYDSQSCGEKLDELGYTLGDDGLRYLGRNPVDLTLLVNSDNSFKVRCAHALAEDLEAVGLGVTVKALGWDEYLKALEEGQFDLYLGECRLTGDLDLTAFFTPGSGLCYGGFWDGELSQALATGRATGSFWSFDQLWRDRAPFGVLCFKTGTVLTAWGMCEGLSPTQGNLFYGLENWTIRE